jgi:hypothetical protein
VRYEDFVLQLDSSSRGFRARVLKSPFGEGAVGFSLPALAGAEPTGHGTAVASRDTFRQSASSATRRPSTSATDEIDGLAALEGALDAQRLDSLTSAMENDRACLALPKYFPP